MEKRRQKNNGLHGGEKMIPRIAHFIWFGDSFPWVYGLAIRSAALNGGFDRVYLHHTDTLNGQPGFEIITDTPKIVTDRMDPHDLLKKVTVYGIILDSVYMRLEQPAAKANVIRAAILAVHGGVYLDTDTLCIGSFSHLLEAGAFCGQEHLALPYSVKGSKNAGVWLKAGIKLGVRDIYRRLPDGWRSFRKIESHFTPAVNNAVLGAEPGHPLIIDLIRRMVEMPEEKQTVRYALGTHLLGRTVDDYEGDGLVIYPAPVFYPLGPEISEHWFRINGNPVIDEVIAPETVLVHWYASVRTKHIVPKINSEYIRTNATRQLFSRMASRLCEFENA